MGKDTGQPPIGEAYDTGDEIVILGTPPEFPDSVPGFVGIPQVEWDAVFAANR